eukprot:1160141-Pelagomonas_calceolata.AAC.8
MHSLILVNNTNSLVLDAQLGSCKQHNGLDAQPGSQESMGSGRRRGDANSQDLEPAPGIEGLGVSVVKCPDRPLTLAQPGSSLALRKSDIGALWQC